VNFLRRNASPAESEEAGTIAADDVDDVEDEGGSAASTAANAPPTRASRDNSQTGRSQATATSAESSDKQQKAAQRSTRMEVIRQARRATSAMQDPEPVRGLMVAAFLIAVGVVSYLSKDVQPVSEKVKGKTHIVNTTVTHPQAAILLVVVALAAAGSTYWRRRYVTAVAFMIAAAIGIAAPLPSGLSDLMWLTFLVPAGYVLWMLMFRMNKEQKAWIAAHSPARETRSATAATGSAKPSQKGKQPPAASRSRKAKSEPVNPNGRALPPNSGRYTRPQNRPRASQRRS
jgi:hypothetical protein